MGKRCTRCLEWKDDSEFYRDRTKLDGLKSQCKACRKLYKREYRARLRALAMVRMKRAYRSIWFPRAKSVTPVQLGESYRRWREKTRARSQARLAAYVRHWHAQHPEASRIWNRHTPEIATVQRQARRAEAACVLVNDLSPAEWKWLVETFGYRCAYCGRPSHDLTPDHITPLSRGGHNTLSNIVPACRTCNSRKGARTPEEADMGLAVQVNVTHQLEQMALI